MIAGVDGCKEKWIAVVDRGNGLTEVLEPCTFLELFENRGLDLIVIDIPIGLPDKGDRKADKAARKCLGIRHVCVFPAPIRPILDCVNREKACEKCVSIGERRVNVFQWAIVPKIRCIDLVLRRGKDAQDRIREGHPEVSFTQMNSGTPLLSKKSTEGIDQRLRLVHNEFPEAQFRLGMRHIEDTLDAYALLWTARRIVLGTERRFPETAELDPFGLRMEISV
jgi:predicted RNase H-like nuclease